MSQQNFTTSTVHKKLNTPPSQTAHIAAVHKKENSLQCASEKSDQIILNIETVSTAMLQPIVIPGMDPVMAAMFAMMQQNHAAQLQILKDDMDRRDRQDEKERKEFIKQSEYNRRKDLEASQAQMQLIMTQMANMNSARPEKPKASAAKIPPFDIENGSESRIRKCHRCEKTNHDEQDCYFKDRPCLNCDKIGHISAVCRTPKRNNSQSGQGQVSGSTNSVEGHLSTVSAKMSNTVATKCNVANTRGKLAQKYPPPEDLDTITVGLSFMQPGSKPFSMKILPDTGANVTAIDSSQAKGITLDQVTQIKVEEQEPPVTIIPTIIPILKPVLVADSVSGRSLTKLLGHFIVHLQKKDTNQIFANPVDDNFAPGYSEIIKQPMDFSTMRNKLNSGKYLNMLHPGWPHQDCG